MPMTVREFLSEIANNISEEGLDATLSFTNEGEEDGDEFFIEIEFNNGYPYIYVK